ncbi:phosphoribosyltransferase-like protein [Epilithonimonas lactis]|uniref:PRTase-CE domain-containing protein n=1 Tax=Epilithonimonas lactis TaxID=421072 RepID=A0A085BMG1_9FLAO|nr:hypothetical protein [Epilithonimonas lactis]KFC23656.1 hypothetical protein IO89_03510 [Epilithonimonas lactis]SEQ20853.1 hypothetical protein SAMN04488097_1670 [Epilithonimonas lactis]
MSKHFDTLPIKDRLEEKIRIFLDSIWKEKQEDFLLENWSRNFDTEEEQVHMLFLLSKFMYFGNQEIRELLTTIYRDLFRYPHIHKIREDNFDTIDESIIEKKFSEVLSKTRFLGIGSPAESGVHLLYYFRQQNRLKKESFITLSEIFKFIEKDKSAGGKYVTVEIKDNKIENYIFIDDFCGTGNQVVSELADNLITIKRAKPDVKIHYFVMFGTNLGIEKLKNIEYLNITTNVMEKVFEDVKAIFKLDDSFKAFNGNSRIFAKVPDEVTQKECEAINKKYSGSMSFGPLGYENCELMLSFTHNTPDNSLPVFWNEENIWNPFFKRFNKI